MTACAANFAALYPPPPEYASSPAVEVRLRIEAQPPSEPAAERAERGPVSYTHLDVYKRQVLDLDGNPQPVVARTDASEMAVTIGADGFSYTRDGDGEQRGFKLGETL